ncbi:MAG: hypothetical protein JST20_05900 [Bacteroidetes bacterium]|nr:hypothetical protein [Bacteroidota bacterium]
MTRFILFLHILLAFTCTAILPCLAQDRGAVENALEAVSQETDNAPIIDAIEYYTDNPLNLRKVKAQDLLFLPGISSTDARRILRLVKKHPDITYSMLADSVGLSENQQSLLERCTTLRSITSGKSAWVTSRTRNVQMVQQIKGLADSSFVGSPIALYQRFTGGMGNARAGITTTKAAGERSFTDFYSGFGEYNDKFLQVVAGDYTIESGLGSILWQPFGAKKGGEVIAPVIQQGSGISPYRSSTEFRFFRGAAVAATMPLSDNSSVAATLWYSSIRRSATIDTVRGVATSIDATGLFRTTTEIAKQNSLGEQVMGGILQWNISTGVSIGASAFSLQYSKPIESSSSSTFLGQSGVLSAVHGSFVRQDMLLLGEISRDAFGNFSAKAGAEFIEKNFKTAISARWYDANFRSPFGYNFGEFSSPNNEIGLYAGWFWRGIPTFEITGYCDIYRSLTPRFGLYVPTRGVDVLTEIRWKISPLSTSILRFRTENKTDAFTAADGSHSAYIRTVTSLRAEILHSLTKQVRTRARIEAVAVDFDNIYPSEIGVVGFAELWWQPDEQLKIGGRLAYYSTDSYNSARWTFEPSVPGVLGNPALYGNGARSFILINYAPLPQISLWVQYSVTAKNTVTSLGSGSTEISGNKEQKAIFQVDISL